MASERIRRFKDSTTGNVSDVVWLRDGVNGDHITLPLDPDALHKTSTIIATDPLKGHVQLFDDRVRLVRDILTRYANHCRTGDRDHAMRMDIVLAEALALAERTLAARSGEPEFVAAMREAIGNCPSLFANEAVLMSHIDHLTARAEKAEADNTFARAEWAHWEAEACRIEQERKALEARLAEVEAQRDEAEVLFGKWKTSAYELRFDRDTLAGIVERVETLINDYGWRLNMGSDDVVEISTADGSALYDALSRLIDHAQLRRAALTPTREGA
jgi:hypothetical protein